MEAFVERMHTLASRMLQEFGEQQIVSITVKRPLFLCFSDFAMSDLRNVSRWGPRTLVFRTVSGDEIEIKEEDK